MISLLVLTIAQALAVNAAGHPHRRIDCSKTIGPATGVTLSSLPTSTQQPSESELGVVLESPNGIPFVPVTAGMENEGPKVIKSWN